MTSPTLPGDQVGLGTDLVGVGGAAASRGGDDIGDAVNRWCILQRDGLGDGLPVYGSGGRGALLRVLSVLLGGGSVGSQRDPDVLVLGRPLGSHDELLDAGGLAAGGINRGLGIAVVVGVLQVREWAVGVLVDLHLGEGETGHLADQELGGQVGFGCCRVPG